MTTFADKFIPKKNQGHGKKPDVQKMAEDHVDWLLQIMRPLMVTEFLHGYKHGVEAVVENSNGNALNRM